ncbi:MAG: hypothetical protein JXB14_05875 [Candidatus Altiarchaeota archaeon]|nr:hypothetical protein [Candidatus Altiarchaeota archaeon]
MTKPALNQFTYRPTTPEWGRLRSTIRSLTPKEQMRLAGMTVPRRGQRRSPETEVMVKYGRYGVVALARKKGQAKEALNKG